MNLRPTYVFDTMQSKGINGINTGRMILVGESLENNTGIFIVNKDTTALTANTTIQQALDGGYLKMLQKKTTEKFGEYQFDNISNSNPVMSGGLTLGKTWLNQTTGEIFITATVNGVTGWKGNKGTSIFKKPIPAMKGFANIVNSIPSPNMQTKDFCYFYFQIWDITNNKQITGHNYTGVCLEKNAKYVKDYKWILTNFPLPFPKWGDVEERALATQYKAQGKTLAVLVTSANATPVNNQGTAVNLQCSSIDYLINFKYYGSGASEEEYVAVEPLSIKNDVDQSTIPNSIPVSRMKCYFLDGEGMRSANKGFPNNGVNGFDVEVVNSALKYRLLGSVKNWNSEKNDNYYLAMSKTSYQNILNNPSKIWTLMGPHTDNIKTITKEQYLSNAWVW